MEIEGIIVSGQGKAAYFMSQPIYKTQFEKRLNFAPFPGTLNVKIHKREIDGIHEIKENELINIEGKGNFGDVSFIKATLNDVDGAVIFPKKTTHGENILEFITHQNLKVSLGLKDGDNVKVILKC